jgi:mRNA guanylyltransferase
MTEKHADILHRYVFGTDQKVLKWKPPHENTIDFRLVLGEFPTTEDEDGTVFEDWEAIPSMELWVNHGGTNGYKPFAELTLTPAEWNALKSLNQQIDGRIIECYRDPQISDRDVWRPKLDNGTPRFRDDKKDANHISTVESVLRSIQDAVTEQDLISNEGVIRSAFKARLKRREEEEKRERERERKRAEEAEREKQRRMVEEDDGPKYED